MGIFSLLGQGMSHKDRKAGGEACHLQEQDARFASTKTLSWERIWALKEQQEG